MQSHTRAGIESIRRLAVITGLMLVSLVACAPVRGNPPVRTSESARPSPTPSLVPPRSTQSLEQAITPSTQPSPTVSSLSATQPPTTPTPAPTSDVAITRGPYLQSVGTDSIVVIWETDRPSRGEVAYTEVGGAMSRASDVAISARHAITLSGLEPYTLYAYRIESDGAPLSEELSFRTAAGPEQGEFAFVAYGDTRTQHEAHRAVAEQIVALAPDFVVHTGDLVDDGSQVHQWETFFEIERDVMARAPLFPALGNHEKNSGHYFDLFHLPGNERWYTFVYGTARFICLQIDGYARFDPESEQVAWLEQTLLTNTHPWLFVVFHIPPYSSLREDATEISIRKTLAPLFEQYGVDVVFNGHHHDYQRSIVNGVTYIITGGGGAPIYAVTREEDHLVAYRNSYHVVLITVDGDELMGVGITPEGEAFDRFAIASPEN